MPIRRILLAAAALVVAAACSGDVLTSPTASPVAGAASANRFRKTGSTACVSRRAATGSAVIGPSGGVLRIEDHLLIIPKGALRENVLISGTVPEGRPFEVDLQPHGLQFLRPAGLILGATSCRDVPPIVYLIDENTVSEPILPVYSRLWRRVACPIWHFSGYAISLGLREEANENGPQ